MEALLLSLDVLFMVVLTLAVARYERKTSPNNDLGFFAHADVDTGNKVGKQGKLSA